MVSSAARFEVEEEDEEEDEDEDKEKWNKCKELKEEENWNGGTRKMGINEWLYEVFCF